MKERMETRSQWKHNTRAAIPTICISLEWELLAVPIKMELQLEWWVRDQRQVMECLEGQVVGLWAAADLAMGWTNNSTQIVKQCRNTRKIFKNRPSLICTQICPSKLRTEAIGLYQEVAVKGFRSWRVTVSDQELTKWIRGIRALRRMQFTKTRQKSLRCSRTSLSQKAVAEISHTINHLITLTSPLSIINSSKPRRHSSSKTTRNCREWAIRSFSHQIGVTRVRLTRLSWFSLNHSNRIYLITPKLTMNWSVDYWMSTRSCAQIRRVLMIRSERSIRICSCSNSSSSINNRIAMKGKTLQRNQLLASHRHRKKSHPPRCQLSQYPFRKWLFRASRHSTLTQPSPISSKAIVTRHQSTTWMCTNPLS
jgi:hypothetical protein